MVPIRCVSAGNSFRMGLNCVISGMAIIVLSIAFRDKLYLFFPLGSPDVLALLFFFIGSTLVGSGTVLTLAGLVGKREGAKCVAAIPQIIIIIILTITLVILVFMPHNSPPTYPPPTGPISI